MLVRFIGLIAVALVVTAGQPAPASEAGTLKIAVLAYGTVSWELDVVRHHGLDRAEGVDIEVVGLAGTLATKIALQAGAADVIVTDWLWVSRQRAAGADFTFAPYSTAVGALMVPDKSPIRGLADLAGRRLGIAGGPLDKSWLLLRALASKKAGADLDSVVEKVFGAPPLLNEQMLSRRIDAVITFWPFAARLEAAGMRRLIGVDEAMLELGLAARVPIIGYVFSAALAAERKAEVAAFMRAVRAARAILRDSDTEWQRIAPLTRAKDTATLHALRDGYRAGIPRAWGETERGAARRLFSILVEVGGADLVGAAPELQPGTFWPALVF